MYLGRYSTNWGPCGFMGKQGSHFTSPQTSCYPVKQFDCHLWSKTWSSHTQEFSFVFKKCLGLTYISSTSYSQNKVTNPKALRALLHCRGHTRAPSHCLVVLEQASPVRASCSPSQDYVAALWRQHCWRWENALSVSTAPCRPRYRGALLVRPLGLSCTAVCCLWSKWHPSDLSSVHICNPSTPPFDLEIVYWIMAGAIFKCLEIPSWTTFQGQWNLTVLLLH